MTVRPFLLSTVIALALSGCGGAADPADDHGHEHAPGEAAHPHDDAPATTPAAAPVTEAVYGDEAPVEIAPVAPADDHDHPHNEDGSHPDEDDHAHPHDDHGDDHDHPHDDEGEPHEH
jgi:hypothetical protein